MSFKTSDHIPLSLSIGWLPGAKIITRCPPVAQNLKFNVDLLSNPTVAAAFAERILAGIKAWKKWLAIVVLNEGAETISEEETNKFVDVSWEGLIMILCSAAEKTMGRVTCSKEEKKVYFNTNPMPSTGDKDIIYGSMSANGRCQEKEGRQCPSPSSI